MMTSRIFKLTVCFERRPDGGLRAYSDDVPGLVLSSLDVDGVLEAKTGTISSTPVPEPVEAKEEDDADGVAA
jgi:hypothetical protein